MSFRPAASLLVLVSLSSCGEGSDHPVDGSPGRQDAGQAAIDASAPVDATSAQLSILDDLAADFGGPGAMESGAVVTAYDAVAPIAYYNGGLVVTGSDTGEFTDAATTTWAQVQAMQATGRRAVAPSLVVDWGAGTPVGIGLTSGDNFTLWYEGEIYLDAGAYTFSFQVDDHGFVEIAMPGTNDFGRVIIADWPDAGIAGFSAATAGWYPIRIAISEQGGGVLMQLRYAVDGGPFVAIPSSRLRFRSDQIQGLCMAVWDNFFGVGRDNVRIDEDAPANQNWGIGYPADGGLVNGDYFSVRWAGQVRLAGGNYRFRLASDDGQRMWIDGTQLLSFWDGAIHDSVTEEVMLESGWHDIVVDHTEAAGDAFATLTVATGPELVGMPLPVDRLRPVIARGLHHTSVVDPVDYSIPDSGGTNLPVSLSAPLDAAVAHVDVLVTVDHTRWSDVGISLVAPNGAAAIIRDHTAMSSSGIFTELVSTSDLAGAPVDGIWYVQVNDVATGDTGTLLDFQLTVHYTTAQHVVPTFATYDSGVQDLGSQVRSIDAVAWGHVAPPGSSVAVRVRTGDTMEACLAAPWSAALQTTGSVPAVVPGQFLQYRIEFATDGKATPWVDWVRVDYSQAP